MSWKGRSSIQAHAIDPELLGAYMASTYRFRHGSKEVALQIGCHSPKLGELLECRRVSTAAYLTAWNPGSRALGLQENASRNDALRQEIIAMGLECLDGEGGTQDWKEASFLILGIRFEDARELAARHGQNAFVFSRNDAIPELVITNQTQQCEQ